MKNRPTLEEFKNKALKDSEIKANYEELKPLYDVKCKLIQMRKEADLTQEDIAKIMHTKRSNISRLESFNYKGAPKITTLMDYAKATGHQLKVEFI